VKFIEKLKFASVCGIDCESQCSIYSAYHSNDELKRRQLALLFFNDENRWSEIRCDGCKGEQALCWGLTCPVKKCAIRQGIEFCIQCHSYPCPALRQRQQKNEAIMV
jgi:hypothetical protein